MNEVIFKIIFVILFVVYILIRVPFDQKYKKVEKIKTVNASGEKFLLFLMFLGLLVFPFLWLFTPFLNHFKMEFPVWLRLIGVATSVISLIYFQWIHKTLGENWSPTLEIRKGHQLIKTGPYKRIRHPMYVQFFLWGISQVLIISNLLAGFSGIIVCLILYLVRVPKEEKMMIENFGDEYIEYAKQAGRIFPKLHSAKL